MLAKENPRRLKMESRIFHKMTYCPMKEEDGKE